MDTTITGRLTWFCQELGLTWKKALLLMGLGAALGLLMALAVPLPVS